MEGRKGPRPTWYAEALGFVEVAVPRLTDEDEAEEPAVGGTGVGRPLPPMKDSAIGESVNDNEAPGPPPPPLCGGGCNDEEELEPPDPDAVAYGCPPLVFGRGAVLIAADPVELAAL